MASELESDFPNATVCHTCKELFCKQDLECVEEGPIFKKRPKVMDLCHFTEVYWGAANEG